MPPTASAEPEKQRRSLAWAAACLVGRWLRRLATGVGAMVLIGAGFSIFGIAALWGPHSAPPALPEQFVLYAEMEGPLHERQPEVGLADPFASPVLTVRELIAAINAAADDDRVQGLFVRVRGGAFGLAHLAEIREAVGRLRTAGKFARVYASSWDGGLGAYYLASAFEEVWVQPMGVVAIAGLRAEQPFFRAALDAIGVEPQMFQRKEYKSVYESVTRNSMSPEARESLTALLDDIAGTLLMEAAHGRGMEEDAMRALIDQGLFTAPEALAAGLVDRVDYADVLVDEACAELHGRDAECDLDETFVDVADYAPAVLPDLASPSFFPEPEVLVDASEAAEEGDQRVALIYANGMILPSAASAHIAAAPAVFTGEPVAAADEIAGAILDAAEGDAYGTIVLRIDSPGGSPVASETIARAIARAQDEHGKTVIVSMGSVAASGGYWIAAPADRIFALPVTITGSIGVAGGKFVFNRLWDHLRVNWDAVEWGENAAMWSSVQGFTPEQSARVGAMLDHVYDSFVARVAAGRGMDPDAVEAVARGRVWTGAQALERGLVDELGGLDAALDYARGGAEMRVDVFPRPLSGFEQLMELLEGGVRTAAFQARLAMAAQALTVSSRAPADQVLVYESVQIR